MQAYKGLNEATNVWTPVAIDDYKERITYDPNGNIRSYIRYGSPSIAGKNKLMDSLNYVYYASKNQLQRVTDNTAYSGYYTEDIDNQATTNNYTYDAIGNLISNASESISSITWTVYGKISTITKNGNNISYTYDAGGNRITKTADGKTTLYVRDASGNVMSLYEIPVTDQITQKEVHLYGSSRLGMVLPETKPGIPVILTGGFNDGGLRTLVRGEKVFELSNHLGNVLVTLSDKKIQVAKGNPNQSQIDYYTADVVSASNYAPFGMGLVGRIFSSNKYRYGFGGKEKDNNISGEGNKLDFGARIYDSRLGRWLSSDPAYTEYPGYSPYNFGLNSPIINLDNDGKRVYYCPGLGGRGADPNGYMNGRWSGEGSAYVESMRKAFGASGVYFRELEGVNGNPGSDNLGFKNNPRLTDAKFVAKYGQKPVQSLASDHRIANAVAQIVLDITQNPLDPSEKVNLIGTSMGAVTTAQAALYILEHKEELGLPSDFKIDNVVLAGSTVNTKSRLYKKLEKAIENQKVNGGRYKGVLRSGLVDGNGENGYNYPEDQDGVTGLAGRNKVDMTIRFGRLVGQIFKGLRFGKKENGKLRVTELDHPHTNAADDPNFGDGLIKQALIKDEIEGSKGKEGAERYLKEKNGG